MRISLQKSVALALALALAAPTVGCAAPTDAEPSEVSLGQTQQAIAAGSVISGAKAAVEIVSMIKSYQEYGQAQISTGQILEAVNAVQADITALKDAVAELQTAVTTSHKDVLNVVALSKTNEMSALWDGYRVASASTDPAVLARFLDAVATNQALQGTLRWSDLATVNDVLVGKNGSSSLLNLMAQTLADDVNGGRRTIDEDALGRFAAEKRLLQEEAFLLLREAAAKDPSVDLAAQTAAHQARMAEQEAAFFKATELFNKLILDKVGADREAKVTACHYADSYGPFDIKMWPDSGWYAYSDYGPNAWTWAPITSGDYGNVKGRVACENDRNDHANHVSRQAKREMRRKLMDAQIVFKTWSDKSAAQPRIQIAIARFGQVSANVTYGLWFDPTSNDITSDVHFLCGNRAACDLKLDPVALGRTDYDRTGQSPSFTLEYTCSGGARKTVSLPSGADNQVVTLSCAKGG
ncbi:MAG: hypothetical protein U0235_33965 [Polyangiaceae bacterium]